MRCAAGEAFGKHAAFEALRRASAAAASPDAHSSSHADGDGDERYLCNGAVLVTTVEPCVMCSMALVHSRVAAVYFAEPNAAHGGLFGSCYRVQLLEATNHRFPAFGNCRFVEEV